MNLESVTKEELFESLGWAIDGINGYQSQCGDLHPYWTEEKTDTARQLIHKVTEGESFTKAIQNNRSADSAK